MDRIVCREIEVTINFWTMEHTTPAVSLEYELHSSYLTHISGFTIPNLIILRVNQAKFSK